MSLLGCYLAESLHWLFSLQRVLTRNISVSKSTLQATEAPKVEKEGMWQPCPWGSLSSSVCEATGFTKKTCFLNSMVHCFIFSLMIGINHWKRSMESCKWCTFWIHIAHSSQDWERPCLILAPKTGVPSRYWFLNVVTPHKRRRRPFLLASPDF